MFDQNRYLSAKEKVKQDLKDKKKSPYDYMQEYKKAIVADDFEYAKAITEVLEPLQYYTADTHRHITQLK